METKGKIQERINKDYYNLFVDLGSQGIGYHKSNLPLTTNKKFLKSGRVALDWNKGLLNPVKFANFTPPKVT